MGHASAARGQFQHQEDRRVRDRVERTFSLLLPREPRLEAELALVDLTLEGEQQRIAGVVLLGVARGTLVLHSTRARSLRSGCWVSCFAQRADGAEGGRSNPLGELVLRVAARRCSRRRRTRRRRAR